MQFLLSDVVSSRLFPTKEFKDKPVREWDLFPDLFTEEKTAFAKSQEEDDFEKFKARRRRFATEHNKKM